MCRQKFESDGENWRISWLRCTCAVEYQGCWEMDLWRSVRKEKRKKLAQQAEARGILLAK